MKEKKQAPEKPKAKKGPKGKIGPRVNKLHIIFALKQANWEISPDDVTAKMLPVLNPKDSKGEVKKTKASKYLFNQLEDIVGSVSPDDVGLIEDLREHYYPDSRKTIAPTQSIEGFQTDYKVLSSKNGMQFVRIPFIDNWWKLAGAEKDDIEGRRIVVQYSKNNIVIMRMSKE